MIITKFLTLLFIALLPWLALSLNEIKTTMKPKDKVDYLKLAADALKDLPLYAEKFEKALQSAEAWNKDFMQILMFAGPFGWVLSVGLGKNKKDLVKAAVGDLSKKIDMLSAHIDDSINRVIAHEDILQFQSEVVLPFKKLREKYKDYLEHLHEEERQKLKQSCKEIKPLDLFDVMDQILTDKWDNLLKSMKYTDYSFNKLNSLYENTMKEMIPIYFTCEALIYDTNVLYNGEQMKNNTKRRTEKLAKRIQAIFTTFDLIKERRPGLVWSIMPKKIEFWHGKFREIKKADRNFQDFSQKMVDELVSDYGN
uniref:Uncharacterized protein n=1 Tax=Panagrolaimus sp. ES5 TaxID=591445 RepID=A0AC34GAR9_9BILA